MRTHHVCADIKGLLREKDLSSCMTDTETGAFLSDTEAREYLNDCLAKGWKVLPFCECEDFDYQTGCTGSHNNEEDSDA